MKQELLSLNEIKQIELELLISFHEICEKYNLKYSLAYGTLLGAKRHGGFIPWDDDIDVMMSRPDYQKFVKIVQNECKGKTYKMVSMHTDPEFFAPLAKFTDTKTRVYQSYGQIEKTHYGVYIDVFIIDGLPDWNRELFYKNAEKLRFKWGMACRKFFAKHKSRNVITDALGSICSIPFKFRGYKYYRDQYDKYCAQNEYGSAKDIAVVVFGEGLKKEQMCKQEFEQLSKIEFEGKMFYAVKTPEDYLTRMYGNYMQLPPEAERVSKHNSKVIRIC